MTQEATGENLYGTDAITGSKEDILAERNVEIKTTDTQVITVKPDSEEEPTEPKDESDKPPVPTTEEKLQNELNTQKNAEQELKKDLDTKGIQWNKLTEEYEKDGTLSESSLQALEKAGYPQTVVNAYIKGLEATAAIFENQVYSFAGGKDNFTQIVNYVKAQGSAYIDTFNNAINSGELSQIKVTLEGFKAQMVQKYGTNNKSLLGNSSNTSGNTKGFNTKAEMTAAMGDKRYGRDPQYTREVEQKTLKSTFF